MVLGAFYYGYVVTQVPGGCMADKYGGKWMFGLGSFISAICTILHPVAARYGGGITLLCLLRVMKGLIEVILCFFYRMWHEIGNFLNIK